MKFELPQNKRTLALWGIGIVGSLIAMYIWSKFFGGSSSSSSGNSLASYAALAQQQAQQQLQESQLQMQSQAQANQFSLQEATINAQTTQAAMAAGSSLANSVAQLGTTNVQSGLQTILGAYQANYAAGTSIADNALAAAASIANTTNQGIATNTASANLAIGQSINSFGPLIQSFSAGTTAALNGASSAAQSASSANAQAAGTTAAMDAKLGTAAILAATGVGLPAAGVVAGSAFV